MENPVIHEDQIKFLRKIEGQIRGIEKMIEDKRYCIDILTQLDSVVGAIFSVENRILKKHLENCVASACKNKSEKEKEAKIKEVLNFIVKFRR